MSTAVQPRQVLNNRLAPLLDRIRPHDLTTSELRRIVAVLAEADDRLAGRPRKTPAQVLHLVPQPRQP